MLPYTGGKDRYGYGGPKRRGANVLPIVALLLGVLCLATGSGWLTARRKSSSLAKEADDLHASINSLTVGLPLHCGPWLAQGPRGRAGPSGAARRGLSPDRRRIADGTDLSDRSMHTHPPRPMPPARALSPSPPPAPPRSPWAPRCRSPVQAAAREAGVPAHRVPVPLHAALAHGGAAEPSDRAAQPGRTPQQRGGAGQIIFGVHSPQDGCSTPQTAWTAWTAPRQP
jgi:hypothetical protein